MPFPGSVPIAAVILCLLVGQAVGAGFRSGVAVEVVTPDPLLPVSGGMGPSSPASEVRGDLTVRALVLENDGQRVALVSADFLGFPKVLGDRVRSRVAGIPGTNILIGATHTHSAPDVYAFPDGQGGTGADLGYIDRVVDRMAAAIRRAADGLEPATVRIASGEARGRIAYNYYAPDLYDPRCHVVQTVRSDWTVQATLVNYAIHPEVLGNRRGICSPDLVGPLYDRLAEAGGGVGVFLNSAQGGMVTADTRRPGGGEANDWEECRRIGGLLADEAMRIVGEAAFQEDPRLRVFARPLRFPVDSPLLLAVLRGSPLGYATDARGWVETTLNVVQLGDAEFVTIPGEALPNIGYYLKRKLRGRHAFLLGLTNDAFGYILTKEDFDSFRRYEYVSRTSLGERTGEILVSEVLDFLAQLPPPESGAARKPATE